MGVRARSRASETDAQDSTFYLAETPAECNRQEQQRLHTLPELRCTFGGRSVVPDVAVIAWEQIQIDEVGEPEDNFIKAPDWTIEILSPDQRATRVIDNILHCLQHGCKLGWMLDPDDYSILVFAPHQEPEVCRGDRQLLVIDGINLALTPNQVFTWLKIGKR